MPTIHENDSVKDQSQEKAADLVPARRSIPAPGRELSFDEALALTLKKYDNALRELAK